MIVVDASVAAKWLLSEPDHLVARRLLVGSGPLVAPALVRIEVAAAISRKVRIGQMTGRQAQAPLHAWFGMISRGTLALWPDETDLPDAFQLALTLAHPLQDCLYLALAIRIGAPLVTADSKFVARASPLYPQVRPLLP